MHGRPVGVVAGSPYAEAPLIAVNTTAKRAGVRSGDRLRDARELCPGFVVCPQRVERYVGDSRAHGLRGRHRPPGCRGPLHRRDFRAALAPRRSRCPLSTGSRVRWPARSRASCPCRSVLRRAPGSQSAPQRRTSRMLRWSGAPTIYPRSTRASSLRILPGAGPRICARLRAAGLTTVEAIHAASRSRDHRRVRFDRGQARAARTPGRGCPGPCLTAALGRARAGANPPRAAPPPRASPPLTAIGVWRAPMH